MDWNSLITVNAPLKSTKEFHGTRNMSSKCHQEHTENSFLWRQRGFWCAVEHLHLIKDGADWIEEFGAEDQGLSDADPRLAYWRAPMDDVPFATWRLGEHSTSKWRFPTESWLNGQWHVSSYPLPVSREIPVPRKDARLWINVACCASQWEQSMEKKNCLLCKNQLLSEVVYLGALCFKVGCVKGQSNLRIGGLPWELWQICRFLCLGWGKYPNSPFPVTQKKWKEFWRMKSQVEKNRSIEFRSVSYEMLHGKNFLQTDKCDVRLKDSTVHQKLTWVAWEKKMERDIIIIHTISRRKPEKSKKKKLIMTEYKIIMTS